MEHSTVFVNLHYLKSLREARGRPQLLQNTTSVQTQAVCEVAKRVVDGTINPLRRDVRVFSRKRLVLITLSSDRVSVVRKKEVIKNHPTLLPVVQTIESKNNISLHLFLIKRY